MNKDQWNEVEGEWWWIDYLEDEVEPDWRKDLEQVLQNSSHAQKTLETFKALKAWVKSTEGADLEATAPDYWQGLHDNIMSQLDKPLEEGEAWPVDMEDSKVFRLNP